MRGEEVFYRLFIVKTLLILAPLSGALTDVSLLFSEIGSEYEPRTVPLYPVKMLNSGKIEILLNHCKKESRLDL
jgi:hypothetical protein